jgi:hypothetical protein
MPDTNRNLSLRSIGNKRPRAGIGEERGSSNYDEPSGFSHSHQRFRTCLDYSSAEITLEQRPFGEMPAAGKPRLLLELAAY